MNSPRKMTARPNLRFWLGAATVAVMILASTGTWVQSKTMPSISIISDSSGERLQVDGSDYMVFGMNWGYMPIGQNYLYELWKQPDEIIEAALAREMPMLLGMGVNTIRQYVGIPPRWVKYIYERYGIFTVLNHPVARYGYTLDGQWIPSVDYSDPRLRAAVKAEIRAIVEEFRGTPGVLMWLIGNENNYGLSWTSFEIEALPEGERNAARARHLYSLFGEIIREIKTLDPKRPVAIANGDVQYIDIVAEECKGLDVFGSNVYRGISARDLFEVVKDKLGVPVMFTEFGSDAFNAKEMREDQAMQARYLLGQWREIYEQSAGKGRVGNAIGGFIFQWSDGWWKFGQESRLDIHDINASWPNGGYEEDFVPGENNMNEEWWGITAKGPSDHRGLYEVYPRAAYYALRVAFQLDPYAPGTNIETIRKHFNTIYPVTAELDARGNAASLSSSATSRIRVSGLRLEFETFKTGGYKTTTPAAAGFATDYPTFQGFDKLQSFYADFEANPSDAVIARLSINILGDVPTNPIDEIFYENRGRPLTIGSETDLLELNDIERAKVYQASISWDDRWFHLDTFFRTGHLHWQYEGDFFGLYRDAFYGENIDIYNGQAPAGFEIAGRRWMKGLKVAYGPELWWGANPAVLVKYTRKIKSFRATAIYHEDLEERTSVSTSSFAIPQPPTHKATLQVQTTLGRFGIEAGAIWSGDTKIGDKFQIAEERGDTYLMLGDKVKTSDTFGAKAKVTYQRGRWNAYVQSAVMGIVAEGGPTTIPTFTGWNLKDTGSGNQTNVIAGLAVTVRDFQIGPNFLYQKPMVGPVPGDVPTPGVPRNVQDDPFAVRANRETVGGELVVTYDPTPATWMWSWDNDVREDARFATSVGYVYRHQPTTQDASIYIASDGRTPYPFGGAPPPQDLWEIRVRMVSALRPNVRLTANLYAGTAEPSGNDPTGVNQVLNRRIDRYGGQARLTWGAQAVETSLKLNDWGPYDYHRDFNLTFPVQFMGDLSHTLGAPLWFGFPQTRFGIRGTWRSLDENSPRYLPVGPTDRNGSEWEFRTYLHFAM